MPSHEIEATWEPERKLLRSLAPKVAAVVDYFADVDQRRLRQAVRALDVAAGASEFSPEDFLRAVADRDDLLELFAQAMEAAARSDSEEKVATIGRLMAAGLAADDAEVDLIPLFLATVADLQSPHFRALLVLARAQQRAGNMFAFVNLHDAGIGVEASEAIIAALTAHGIIQDAPRREGWGQRQQFTQYGQRLVEFLAHGGR